MSPESFIGTIAYNCERRQPNPHRSETKSKSETTETSYHEHQIKSCNSQRLRIRFPHPISASGQQASHPSFHIRSTGSASVSLCIRSIIPSGDAQSRSYKHPSRKDKIYPHSTSPSLPILQASKPTFQNKALQTSQKQIKNKDKIKNKKTKTKQKQKQYKNNYSKRIKSYHALQTQS